MIVVSGAAGFIGSCLVRKLNDEGHRDLILVDEFETAAKNLNLEGKEFIREVDREVFLEWLVAHVHEVVSIIFLCCMPPVLPHMG